MHNIKLLTLAIFNVQVSSVKYIKTLQPICRTFFILQNWNSVPIKQYSSFPSPPQTLLTTLLSLTLIAVDTLEVYSI